MLYYACCISYNMTMQSSFEDITLSQMFNIRYYASSIFESSSLLSELLFPGTFSAVEVEVEVAAAVESTSA